MKYNRFTRRMFLQGSGAALSIPVLTSLLPREARAAVSDPIKRYLNYCIDFDYGHNRNWFPKLTTLANPLSIPGNPNPGSYERLTSLLGGRAQLSPIINSAFNPYLDQMMLYKGLDVVSHGFHTTNESSLGTMYYVGGGSLDGQTPGRNPKTESFSQIIARHAKIDPASRPSYHLGTRGRAFKRDTLGNIVNVNTLGYHPYQAYNVIFNNGTYPESGEVIQNPRHDLLNRVLSDYQRVINGRQIGTTDKVILTNAMDAVADLQRGLTQTSSDACRYKTTSPMPANTFTPGSLVGLPTSWDYWTKLIIAIFQCDISRSLTFMIGPPNEDDWTGLPNKDYHGNVTHKNRDVFGGKENWQRVAEYHGQHYREVVAPLIQRLDSCVDSANGKSYLHNGLFHFCFETAETHRQANVPTLTFGSLNGALPTGYMVNYCDPTRPFTFGGGTINGGSGWSDDLKDATDPMTDSHSYDYPGIPYNRWLVSLLQAWGLSPADYEDPNLNRHMLNRTDSLYGDQNNGISHVGGFGITSIEDLSGWALTDGNMYHHVRRMRRYNWHHYKYPAPLPPKV